MVPSFVELSVVFFRPVPNSPVQRRVPPQRPANLSSTPQPPWFAIKTKAAD
jgi:hypothetical protein